jgi:hypothetical protein
VRNGLQGGLPDIRARREAVQNSIWGHPIGPQDADVGARGWAVDQQESLINALQIGEDETACWLCSSEQRLVMNDCLR